MRKAPKAVLFDMDGVLINSMPMHVAAWRELYKSHDIELSEEFLYAQEGRVGTSLVAKVFKEEKGIALSKEEALEIYHAKISDVKSRPLPERMQDMLEFVHLVKDSGCAISVVTGSGQPTLMDTLSNYYPNCFEKSMTVCAHDVTQGKPHPEPYLMGLKKHGIAPEDAIVVENAPLGTEAGKAAGIFVLGLNSGKLSNETLSENGADVVVKTAAELITWWKENIEL